MSSSIGKIDIIDYQWWMLNIYIIIDYYPLKWILSITATCRNGKTNDILSYFHEKWFLRKNNIKENFNDRKRRCETDWRPYFSDVEDENDKEERERRLGKREKGAKMEDKHGK